MKLSNRKWSEEELFERREEVLARWPTGREVDIDEAIEYRKQLPDEKDYCEAIEEGRKAGKTLVCPIVGHATIEETIEHMKYLEQGGADLLYLMADTHTRKRKYEEAQRGIKQSLDQGRSVLNGYPIVNHGVKNTREITESMNVPIEYQGWTDEDSSLNVEIALACGFASGSHDLHDLIQHVKDYPLDKRIQNNQYQNRLAGYYTERGAPVDVFIPANLCGWDPLGIKIAITVLGCLLTAEQGVKSIILCLVPTCHLIQDVAGLKVIRRMAEEYLHRFGYDVQLATCFSSWQGDWPRDLHRAASLAAWNAAEGVLGGTDYLLMRSLQEGAAIATKETNLAVLKICEQVIKMLGKQRLADSDELKLEEQMTELEVRAIVDRVLELGDGDAAVGQVEAVKRGQLDAAFSPWIHLQSKVLPVRDNSGAIRYLDPGNLPLPKEVLDYHRQKIRERERSSGMKADIQMVVHDVTCLSK